MGNSRSFWRESNVFRLAGLIMVIGGQFLPQFDFSGMGFAGRTNVLQVCGFIIFFMPMIKELIRRPKA